MSTRLDREETVKTNLFAALLLASALTATGAAAQPAPFNQTGVTMGHWHLISNDIEANKKLFLAMGGKLYMPGGNPLMMFPGLYINLNLGTEKGEGGTQGTVVNHVGFLVPDVQASVAKWKAAGVAVEPGGNGRKDQAFVTTPDGLRIEILEDKAQTVPIKSHHVHFYVAEAEIPKIQAWYAKHFGAKPGMRGTNVADDLPGVNLSFSKSATPTVPIKGHTLDHIGFDVKNLEAFMKKLEADGVKIERPYNKNKDTGAALGFVSDPWGTLIELNDRPKPL
jgi:catechol 2,3-dioxygenase-like lactoylglutathione lyase family enzyme